MSLCHISGDLPSLIKSEFFSFDLLNWHVSSWGVLPISERRPSSISQVASDRCRQAPPRNFLINWASFATCRTSALWTIGRREQGEIFGLVFLRYCGGYGARPTSRMQNHSVTTLYNVSQLVTLFTRSLHVEIVDTFFKTFAVPATKLCCGKTWQYNWNFVGNG